MSFEQQEHTGLQLRAFLAFMLDWSNLKHELHLQLTLENKKLFENTSMYEIRPKQREQRNGSPNGNPPYAMLLSSKYLTVKAFDLRDTSFKQSRKSHQCLLKLGPISSKRKRL